MTEFLPRRRRMRNMAGICVVAISAAVALQGCAGSGTVAVVVPGGTMSPAASTGTATATGTSTSTGTATAAPTETSAPGTSQASSPSLPPDTGGWTPQGGLATAVPIDTVVNPDKSVTVTYPRGAQPGHALTIKLKATRDNDKLVVATYADNESGQQVSLMAGLFSSSGALDDHGNSMNFESLDPGWTLGSGDGRGDIAPGQPLTGNMVIDAPASGSTFNLYWEQAVGPVGGVMSGVILIRNIPIN